MLCFEIDVNGTRLCRSGIGEFGVLVAQVSWIKRDPARTELVSHPDAFEEELGLQIRGLSEEAHLHWPSPDLKRGDIVTIRVVEIDETDEPARVERIDRDEVERAERKYYERLKKRFEPGD